MTDMSAINPTRRQLTAAQCSNSSPASASQATVFIVNGNATARTRTEALIHQAGWQTESFATVEAFLRRPPDFSPACLIIDVATTDLPVLNSYARHCADGSGVPIILTRGAGEVLILIQAGEAGASGFSARPCADTDLLSTVSHALDLCESVLFHEIEIRQLEDRYASLSGRERQVMALVATGLMNKQVGGELGISEITVKAHRGRVMRKMNVRTLAELVRITTELRNVEQRRRGYPRPDGSLQSAPWNNGHPTRFSGLV